ASVTDGALLAVEGLHTHFRVGGWLGRPRWLRAVDGVSLTVGRQETVGLVGESGAGKTTFAPTGLRLVGAPARPLPPRGPHVARLSPAAFRPLRRRIQIVFQNPYASLNPRKTVGRLVGQPLAVHRVPGDHARAVAALLERVGLPADAAGRYPHQFSGGQRQRI